MSQYRTVTRCGTRLGGILLLLVALAVGTASAQVTAQLQGDAIQGTVRDAGTGRPVPYALVMVPARDLRVFTSEAGRFTLSGLGPGTVVLEVRQIGYAPVTFNLLVTRPDAAAAPPPLVLELTRQALVLPEILVTAMSCPDPRRQEQDPASRAILDQAITNAERLLTMAHEYPLTARFERLRAGFTAADSAIWFRWDTLTSRSERTQGYKRGRVMVAQFGRAPMIQYFTTSDIARKEFLENHCLWVVGEEEIDGLRVVRIDFAPGDKVKSPDWTGALFLDASSGLLRRSQASLTSIPKSAPGGLLSARCEVSYVEIVPTLVHEKSADCWLGLALTLERSRREVWGLLSWEFTGRRPGG